MKKGAGSLRFLDFASLKWQHIHSTQLVVPEKFQKLKVLHVAQDEYTFLPKTSTLKIC